jgi:hypothetical protein
VVFRVVTDDEFVIVLPKYFHDPEVGVAGRTDQQFDFV